ncbi:MAG: hypothetical protein J0L63_17930 [Anaerolineae bacterium]|nr:hypothetical protein [Anaerolineae bacterium]
MRIVLLIVGLVVGVVAPLKRPTRRSSRLRRAAYQRFYPQALMTDELDALEAILDDAPRSTRRR